MVYVGRIRYAPPKELPGGFWETLRGLSDWILEQLRKAYESGYMAGKMDALRACKESEDTQAELEHFLLGFGSKAATPS